MIISRFRFFLRRANSLVRANYLNRTLLVLLVPAPRQSNTTESMHFTIAMQHLTN
jgi:hypothetical protein